ncbi:MAG TPA: hypothetical protein VEI97_01550, partial [bacterium]|nr:hypothetical protein [bacterium]
TLPNSRHEAFAQALAQGYPPPFAYTHAGFDSRNAKARASRLAKNKTIRQRVKILTTTLPRIQALQARFAPSALLMPESKEQMAAWLWQIATGQRHILPHQLRAATLFARLNGWHLLTPSRPKHPSPHTADPATPVSFPVTPAQRSLLTTLAQQIIAADQAHQPLSPDLAQAFLATMTDTLIGSPDHPPPQPPEAEATEAPSTPAEPPLSPEDEAYHTRIRTTVAEVKAAQAAHKARAAETTAAAAHAATAAAANGPNPPNLPISSPTQPPHPQHPAPETAKTASNSASPSPALKKPASTTHRTPAPDTSSPSVSPSSRSPHDRWSDSFLRSLSQGASAVRSHRSSP